MAKKQTAGRDNLGKLAPKFAELNDDVLFGEVWSREKELSPRDRSMITIAALFSAGLYPQLKAHLAIGKEHGVTKQEAVEIVTQLAFYCGWPKAWSTFPLIQEVFCDEESELDSVPSNLSVFPVGKKNDAYAQYFIGQSYLAPVFTAHIIVEPTVLDTEGSSQLLQQLQSCLADHFDVEHSTFQLEPAGHDDCEATHA